MQKTAVSAVAVLMLGSMSLLYRSSIGSLAGGASNSVHRQSLWAFSVRRDGGLSAGLAMREGSRSSSHR